MTQMTVQIRWQEINNIANHFDLGPSFSNYCRCSFKAVAQEPSKTWFNKCMDSFLFEFETRLNENKSSQNPVLKTPLQQQLPKATWPWSNVSRCIISRRWMRLLDCRKSGLCESILEFLNFWKLFWYSIFYTVLLILHKELFQVIQ